MKIEGEFSFENIQPRLELANLASVSESLCHFTEELNKSGRIQSILDQNRNNNRIVPLQGEFCAGVHEGTNIFFGAGINGLQFYSDTDHAITLGIKPDNYYPFTFG